MGVLHLLVLACLVQVSTIDALVLRILHWQRFTVLSGLLLQNVSILWLSHALERSEPFQRGIDLICLKNR